MDYGKYRYNANKKKQEAKKKQKQIGIKEVKFRPGNGHWRLRRQAQEPDPVPDGGQQGQGHPAVPRPGDGPPELGMEMLERVEEDLADIGVVEQRPKMEGRQMVMVIGPKRH